MLRILNNVVATFVYRKNIHEIFETFVISMTDITRFHLEFSLAKKKISFSVSMCNVNNQAETRSSFPRALESQHVPDRERERERVPRALPRPRRIEQIKRRTIEPTRVVPTQIPSRDPF